MRSGVTATALVALLWLSPTTTSSMKLDTPDNPRLKIYNATEEGITTWEEARDFCSSRGRLLPTRLEWCAGLWNGYKPSDVYPSGAEFYGNVRQWAPLRSGRNHFVQIGNTFSVNGESEACKSYPGGKPVYKIINYTSFCTKPEPCEGFDCIIQCPKDAVEAFYPDPNDCSSVCYCSGTEEGSFYKQADPNDESAEIWNPWCEGSTPLDYKRNPLGGMRGGCFARSYYVKDKKYCDASLRTAERKLAEESTKKAKPIKKRNPKRGRNLASKSDVTPDLLLDPGYVPAPDQVMCTSLPEAPPVHKNCAAVWGDPHTKTFDGLSYECQGSGHHILSTSLDSGFELQGAYSPPRDTTLKFQVTMLTGFHITTGHPDEPTVEFEWLQLRYRNWYFNNDPATKMEGKEQDTAWAQKGTMAMGQPYLHFFKNPGNIMYYFEKSGIQLIVRYHWGGMGTRLGSYMDLELCLPDEMVENERIIGILGSPNNDTSDDWMDRNGNNLHHENNTKWKDAFEYCQMHWCIRDAKRNNFMKPKFDCNEEYDPTLENIFKKVPPAINATCGGRPECMTDYIVSGDPVIGAKSKQTQKDLDLPDMTIDPDGEEWVEEDDQKRALEQFLDDLKKNIIPGANGDPHLTTWTGVKFDFHGECDLVLVQNPDFAHGLGLDVHIRTKIDTWWSFIETAAVRIGDNVLEISGGKEKISYYLDGEKVEDMQDGDGALGDFSIRFKRHSIFQSQTRVDLGDGNAISIETYKRFVRVNVKADTNGEENSFQGSYGMLGSYPNGHMVARDKVTIMEDINAFGQEWMVLATEAKLFHSESGVQPPMKCRMPDAEQKTKSRRLGEAMITEEDATVACAHVREEDRSACIFDVMVVGDEGMAGTY